MAENGLGTLIRDGRILRWGGGLLLLAGAMVGASWLAHLRREFLAAEAALWERRLQNAAQGAAEEISLRLELLKRDGEALASYPPFLRLASGKAVSEDGVRQALRIPVEGYGYRQVLLMGPGRILGAKEGEGASSEGALALPPPTGGLQVFLPPGEEGRSLAVVVPLRTPPDGGATPGAWRLVLLADGERLLGGPLRRAAASAAPAHLELRARDASGEVRIPLAEGFPPVKPPVAGGAAKAPDFSVQAAVRGEPWTVVAWVARREALAPAEGRFRLQATLAASLYALLVGLLLLWIQRRDVAAARNLEEAHRRHLTLLGNLPGIAYRCANDPSWTMEFLSEGCRHLTGYAPEDLVGNARLSYADLIHPDDRERVYRSVQEAVREGRRFTLAYRIRTRTGETRHVWEQGTGVFDAEGRLEALEGFITDVTEKVEAQRSLEEVQEELAQARYLQSLGFLVGGLAHEVRNPLFALQTVAAGLRRKLGDRPDLEEFFRHLDEQSSRLVTLMKDLLEYGKPLPREDVGQVELEEVLRSAVRSVLLARGLAEGRVSLSLAAGARVRGNQPRLERVFVNLLANALDHSPEGEAVEIRLEVGEGRAVVWVRDRGSGIPEEILPHLFEPFVTGRKGGTGLGLAIVRRIVESHGGTVEARNNTPEKGATFRVELPLLS